MKVAEARSRSHQRTAPDGRVADGARITGQPPEQIARALACLRPSPLTPAVSRKDGDGRYPIQTHTERAFRETVANIVAHRNYEAQGSLTMEDMCADGHPIRRNPPLTGFVRYYEATVTGGQHHGGVVREVLGFAGETASFCPDAIRNWNRSGMCPSSRST